jgi:hypothetical protein
MFAAVLRGSPKLNDAIAPEIGRMTTPGIRPRSQMQNVNLEMKTIHLSHKTPGAT